jgi:D-tyrosyl-tRNA(Tyr) deacylase
VRRASVQAGSTIVGEIGPGAMVLVGVARGDTNGDALHLARKVSRLRIFNDAEGRLNEPIAAVGGDFLAVSQFTLYGDCRKGNRPSYREAAEPEEGLARYLAFVEGLRGEGHRVETGRFQEAMVVALENDGPVTIILESTGRTRA